MAMSNNWLKVLASADQLQWGLHLLRFAKVDVVKKSLVAWEEETGALSPA